MSKFISGLSVLFHVYPCQYHTVLIPVVLQQVLKSGRMSLFHDCFGYQESLEIQYRFWNNLVHFIQKGTGVLIGLPRIYSSVWGLL